MWSEMESRKTKRGGKVKPPGVCQQHVTGVAHHYSTSLYIPFTPHLSLRLKCVEWFGKVFFKRKALFCLFAPCVSNQDQKSLLLSKFNRQSFCPSSVSAAAGFTRLVK